MSIKCLKKVHYTPLPNSQQYSASTFNIRHLFYISFGLTSGYVFFVGKVIDNAVSYLKHDFYHVT